MPIRNFVILIGGPGLYYSCDPVHDKTWSNYVALEDIQTHASTVKPKIDADTDKTSEFYGCYTAAFARRWNQQFEVATEGAENKITFQAIYQGNPVRNVLDRLKTQPTNAGSPNWQQFAKPQNEGN